MNKSIIASVLVSISVYSIPAYSDVIVLCYHDFDETRKGSMTIKTSKFEHQMKYIKDKGYTFISMDDLYQWKIGKKQIPENSVVLTVDDGKKAVLTDLMPIVNRYQIPTTLFIFPSGMSAPKYFLTWDQLAKLNQNPLVDIQSHTYWHPNFNQEKKRLSHDEYVKFVNYQFAMSKKALEKRMNKTVNYMAWPFGIFDQELESISTDHYKMSFSIKARPVSKNDKLSSIPRYMIVESTNIKDIIK